MNKLSKGIFFDDSNPYLFLFDLEAKKLLLCFITIAQQRM